jgi:phenylalanyl-tRNA synthetase beta chain
MKVSLKWLRDYVDIVTTPADLAQRLTMGGVEIGGIEDKGEVWDRKYVFVGQITALAPHPNADRLQMVTVDYSSPASGPRFILLVTGAFNIAVGDKVPLVLAGARVRNEHSGNWEWTILKPGKVRGVESAGMVCSPRELDLGEMHEGILILPADAPLGMPLADYLGDAVLDLDIKGRWDCLSMLGVAREVAAIQQVQLGAPTNLRLPADSYATAGEPAETLIDLKIADPDLCPRYAATVIRGVTIGPSPAWLQERLLSAGMRPINNIVDVTNYVMLEWNQPLHAFDYDRIRGQQIVVRRAGDWTRFTTLDGQQRELTPDMLMIADAQGPVALAGVMGGLDSEVTEATTNILLESANFNPTSVRRTGRALRLASEAQVRFEKGLPPEQAVPAVRRATRLIQALAGGMVAPGVADCYPAPRTRQSIRLPHAELKRLMGLDYTPRQVGQVLDSLGCEWHAEDGVYVVLPPFQRPDLTIPADLVEEVARLVGYEGIPATLLRGAPPAWQGNPARDCQAAARDVLAAAGFWEVISYPLTNQAALARLAPAEETAAGSAPSPADVLVREIAGRLLDVTTPPVQLANPLTPEMAVLRTSAVPALLDHLSRGLRQQDRDVALYEFARIYTPRAGDLPEERRVLTVARGQYVSGQKWGSKDEADFFALKAVAQELLDKLGLTGVSYQGARLASFHPGRTAVILATPAEQKGKPKPVALGVIGELHPAVRGAFDLRERVYLLALDFDRVIGLAGRQTPYEPLAKFPPVMQDLAVVVDATVPAAKVEEAIWHGGGKLLRALAFFDRYQGDPIPAGKVSLAYTLTFQAADRTLTDEEVAAAQKKIVGRLAAEVGGALR